MRYEHPALATVGVQQGSDVFVVRSSLPALSDEGETSRTAAEALEVILAHLVLDQL